MRASSLVQTIFIVAAIGAAGVAAAEPTRAVFTFGPLAGNGAVLPGGHILTAGHCVVPYMEANDARAWRKGRTRGCSLSAMRPGWRVCWLPKPGDYPALAHPTLSKADATNGRWNDLALIKAPALPAHGSTRIRKQKLVPGEQVQVIGRQGTGAKFCQRTKEWTACAPATITARVASVNGANAVLEGVSRQLEGGYSGSPVFDRQGQLVGILSARLQGNRGLVVGQPLLGDAAAAAGR